MDKFNYKNSDYVVSDSVSLEEVMERITLNQRGAVIVVNDNGTLLGILTDGDIRRSLLKHATLITPISKVFNINVISLSKDEEVESRSQEIFNKNTVVNLIPIVEKNNRLVDVIVRNRGSKKE